MLGWISVAFRKFEYVRQIIFLQRVLVEEYHRTGQTIETEGIVIHSLYCLRIISNGTFLTLRMTPNEVSRRQK